jgi:hypothetical protein
MPEEDALTHQQIQDIAQREGVNNPIMSARVVGNRVELHLLGGAIHATELERVPIPTTGSDSTVVSSSVPPTPRQYLSSLTVSQLKQLAAILNLNIPSKVKKGQLVELMAPYSLAELKEAANKIQLV